MKIFELLLEPDLFFLFFFRFPKHKTGQGGEILQPGYPHPVFLTCKAICYLDR